jgi:beta-galactosidase
MNRLSHGEILFGAAYYPEYLPASRLEVDLDLMQAAGFNVIRVGESVWSTWEPEDGRFELEWLAPVLEAAYARGIGVILGTPSYAVPPWLRRKHPETTAQRSTGTGIPYGHRQNVDFTNPTFKGLVERVVRQIVGRYATHPAIIGWQIDNEPGLELFHNPAVVQGFVDDLRRRYGTVDALNDRWGLTFWSHRISRWEELWPPEGNTDPPYDLAWRRYQARLTTEFIEWQASLVRSLAGPHQFVTTCLALGRPAVDPAAIGRTLDVAAANIYYPMQDGLAYPDANDRPELRPMWMPTGGGLPGLILQADIARGIQGRQFLVTETHATSVGEHSVTYPPYDGQLRLAAWALLSRGARMIEYWHWHTIHYGNEAHWGGILGHALQPGRVYEEIARLGAELGHLGEALTDLEPEAPVAMLVSPASRWALEFQPFLTIPGTSQPDKRCYGRVLGAFHRGFFDEGIGTAILQPEQLPTNAAEFVGMHPALVVPALYVASDELLDWLCTYAEAGGHLVLTVRTAYADDEGRIRAELMPGRLLNAAGVHYLEASNLADAVPVRVPGLLFAADAKHVADETQPHATGWADGLVIDDADALAFYLDPHLTRWPAVTSRQHGRGRVTYVGTVPDRAMARTIAAWVARISLSAEPWRVPSGASLTRAGARTPAGERLHVLSNWGWDPQSFLVPAASCNLLNDQQFATGDLMELQAWDVAVLLETDGGTRELGEG